MPQNFSFPLPLYSQSDILSFFQCSMLSSGRLLTTHFSPFFSFSFFSPPKDVALVLGFSERRGHLFFQDVWWKGMARPEPFFFCEGTPHHPSPPHPPPPPPGSPLLLSPSIMPPLAPKASPPPNEDLFAPTYVIFDFVTLPEGTLFFPPAHQRVWTPLPLSPLLVTMRRLLFFSGSIAQKTSARQLPSLPISLSFFC